MQPVRPTTAYRSPDWRAGLSSQKARPHGVGRALLRRAAKWFATRRPRVVLRRRSLLDGENGDDAEAADASERAGLTRLAASAVSARRRPPVPSGAGGALPLTRRAIGGLDEPGREALLKYVLTASCASVSRRHSRPRNVVFQSELAADRVDGVIRRARRRPLPGYRRSRRRSPPPCGVGPPSRGRTMSRAPQSFFRGARDARAVARWTRGASCSRRRVHGPAGGL